MRLSQKKTNELRNERLLPPEKVWERAENRLSKSPSAGLNTALEAVDRWAEDPTRVAFIVKNSPGAPSDRWTYAQVSAVSSRLATGLRKLGVRRGDRVASLQGQTLEAYLTATAVWRMGAVLVPIYPGFGTEGVVQRTRPALPSAIISDANSFPTLSEALTESGSNAPVIIVDDKNWPGKGLPSSEVRGFWEVVDSHAADAPVVNTKADETATLLYTSGTTGTPKGCLLPHSYLLTMQPYVRHTYGLGRHESFASTSGPGWVNGLYSAGMCVTAAGTPRMLFDGRFDAADWLTMLDEERIDYLSSAPSAMRRIIPALRERGLPSSLRAAASAGEHVGAGLANEWATITGRPLQETYGTTEIGLVMATPFYEGESVSSGALPPVTPGFEVALMNPAGEFQDDEGIIAVRNPGYQGCTGYDNAPEKWEERWRGDWYLTGDLAMRDDKGQLWYRGRDDDLIVTSGYNVGPSEVENAIMDHPGVSEVAVIAAPDPSRGSVVRAVIVPNSGASHEQMRNEVKEFVKSRLGRHAYPRIIDFADELPRNPAGKLQRALLRDTNTDELSKGNGELQP